MGGIISNNFSELDFRYEILFRFREGKFYFDAEIKLSSNFELDLISITP